MTIPSMREEYQEVARSIIKRYEQHWSMSLLEEDIADEICNAVVKVAETTLSILRET